MKVFVSYVIIFFLFPFFSSAQVKIRNLYFNSPQNITKLNFTGTIPAIEYSNISSGTTMGNSEGIAHAEDKHGNIVIWVNANHVYDKEGKLMPGSNGILAHPSSTEIVICPFPYDTSRYYIIYNGQLCSNLYYAVVNMNLRNGFGDLESINNIINPLNTFAEGLEIVRIPCSANYWLLTYQCDKGFVRFNIDQDGIHSPFLLWPYMTNNHGGRGELEYHHNKIGYAVTFRNKAFFADFNPSVGTISNPKEVPFSAINGMYGLEFSPDASKVFLTDWDNRDFTGNFAGANLFRYDFSTSSVTSYNILNKGALCGSTDVRGLGQIELGADAKLYIPHMGGCQISVIENTDSANPLFTTIDVNSILSSGVSDHIQSDIFPELKISEDANICKGDSILLQISGGTNYVWSPSGYLSTPHDSNTIAFPNESTLFKVFSENQFGCQDSASVYIKVNVPPAFSLGPDISLCENTSVVLDAHTSEYENIWSDGSTSSQLLVFAPGTYWVKAQQNNCISSDTIIVSKIKRDDITIPNLFTPNNDSKNDFFEIIGHSGRISLFVYNRWGEEVFQSQDYHNTWDAKGLSDGIYFYIINEERGCIRNEKGWVQIIK